MTTPLEARSSNLCDYDAGTGQFALVPKCWEMFLERPPSGLSSQDRQFPLVHPTSTNRKTAAEPGRTGESQRRVARRDVLGGWNPLDFRCVNRSAATETVMLGRGFLYHLPAC